MKPASLITDQDIGEMLSLASATPPGAFIEVGVYKGGSAWHLARLATSQNRTIYLCDTFSGMPHYDESQGDSLPLGSFSDVDFDTVRNGVQEGLEDSDIRWVWGVFPQSFDSMNVPVLGQMGVQPNIVPDERFAFAHLDCDQYRSVRESCEWLLPRMVPGGVIWFDDVDRLAGATRAAEELFEGRLRREFSHAYVRL